LSPFKEGKLGATLTSSLDGILIGASSGVTACAAELKQGCIAAKEFGRNNESVQDVLSSSQQQSQTAEQDDAVESARRRFAGCW
jgi:hypothetical protein